MAVKSANSNSLVIAGKPDTSLNVQLHPLVLLTISDYITRHTLRQQKGPIVGAIIGQQNGRNFTLEHAFECKLADSGSDVTLDADWFTAQLEMYKEVHKAPALDLVALFTLGPVDGPQPAHLPVLKQVQTLTSSDSIMLLMFHPELVDNLQGGKLPITLYESVEEMEADTLHVRFRELQFEVETGDAEMIGVDFVAKGGGNATAVRKAEVASGAASGSKEKKGKGKGKAKDEETESTASTSAHVLSSEEEELVSSLTAKANAIKMLNERLDLIRSYLIDLPPSYLNGSSSNAAPDNVNFPLLRSVNSLLSRLPLLTPPATSALSESQNNTTAISHLEEAKQKQKEDVNLTSLLSTLTRSVAEAQSLGNKFGMMQREKANKDRMGFGGRGGPGRGDDGVMADNGMY